MNTKFLALFAGLSCLLFNNASAQIFSDYDNDSPTVAEDSQAMPKPISLIDGIAEEDSAENATNAETVDLESYDPSVSFYVQNLNLSPEQLSEAQKISLDTLAEQEELFQKIAALRQQARALEVSSLLAFEAILDDSQRAALQELRANFETSNGQNSDISDTINAE